MKVMAWFAMLLIHTSSLPSVYASLTDSGALPPLSLVTMVWFGLFILFVKAIEEEDTVYTFGNGAGLLINTLTLLVIVFR